MSNQYCNVMVIQAICSMLLMGLIFQGVEVIYAYGCAAIIAVPVVWGSRVYFPFANMSCYHDASHRLSL